MPTSVPGDFVVVIVGSGRFFAEVADDPDERSQGLSGRDSLAIDTGMWFDRGVERVGPFWMRDMRFPIDMVWVSEGLEVIGVTHEAPPPAPGTPDSDLPLYGIDAAVRYVLEINAGLARTLGIEPGVRVTLEAP